MDVNTLALIHAINALRLEIRAQSLVPERPDTADHADVEMELALGIIENANEIKIQVEMPHADVTAPEPTP
jgi:hypothetical protein